MSYSILEKFTIERSLIFIVIIAGVLVFGFIFYLFFGELTKNIQVLAPNGGEEWELGKSYQITWRAKGIEKVGIVLFKGENPQWIAKNVSAKLAKYEWKIPPSQECGPDYWLAVFEYPWQKGNRIDYSNGAFAIIFPKLGSCDFLSTENEWPFLSSNLPNLRRVFITEGSYRGDLGGLEGADKKCQQEAENQEFGGDWIAFLGGDLDEDLAIERLKRTPKKTDGIFIEAQSSATLISQLTCHRLLARNFDEFLKRFSDLLIANEEKLEENFLEGMENLWLGRIDEKSKKNCIPITAVLSETSKSLAEKYSFTTTCQNWTQGNKLVSSPTGPGPTSYPTCYTPEGKSTTALALGGLASGLSGKGKDTVLTLYQGKYCDTPQKLLCIEK